MKDFLQDLIQNTHGLGVVDLVKITGTAQETRVDAIAEDRSVVISGVYKTVEPEVVGIFGMPNLGKLKTILGFEEYNKEATILVQRENRNGEDVATAIHFETKDQDFINDYRLMTQEIVENKIKKASFKGVTWNVEFEPNVASILRLKKQAQANSEELNFSTKVENGNLKIYFGDHSTHSGNFVFQANVTGRLNSTWQWPVKVFLSILDLPGDKCVRISDSGATEITVDTGLANYSYIIPAQSK
jgi:hypothetical protein